jgi:xanthine dehydrogenase accessory factor
MKNLVDKIVQCLDAGHPVVMVTIVSQSGSTPRTAGTRMLVMPDGTIRGTIGGGRVEAEIIQTAAGLFGTGRAQIKSFELNEKGAADDLDIICGGRLSLLLEAVDATRDNLEFFQDVNTRIRQGVDCLAVTSLSQEKDGIKVSGRYLLTNEDPATGHFPYPDHVLNALISKTRRENTAGMLTVDGTLFMLHPIQSGETVYIFGAGHVSQQLARLTKMVGFHTIVLDDRKEFANRRRFRDADDIVELDTFDHAFDGLTMGSQSYIVIVTRGHTHDKTVLGQALKTGATYIGMIGSRRKRNIIYQKLLGENFTQADIDRVHSPIGLAIGAETPEEIAVSIIAELIQIRATSKARSKVTQPIS